VEKYTEGLRLTARAGLPAGTVNKLKHRLADARVKQNDLRGAARLLQEIRAAAPEDERARFRLIDLALRTGDRETALRELDDLVGLYRGRNELHKASALLEDLVQAWPLDEQVVVRLANTYAMLGQKDKALAALDALGDRQLSAGQNAAAVQTIERILALAPPNAAEYHQLLAQLKPERS
jgi:thioredoxin-like negative regulator of GroEL